MRPSVSITVLFGAAAVSLLATTDAPAQVRRLSKPPQEAPRLVPTPAPLPKRTITPPAPPPAPAPAPAPAPPAPQASLLVGTGVADITGPIAEVTMMGYANSDQVAMGIQQRLWARAFAFSTQGGGARFVFVSAELGQLFSSVKQGVVKRLMAKYGGLYDDRNVMISATHTHAGPGGYSHHAIFNLTSWGFIQQNYDAIVDGITKAIIQAHERIAPATMRIATGDVHQASVNRSVVAYDRNPDKEPWNVNREMTLVRVDRPAAPAGVIAWFGVHNTSLGKNNRFVSSDHKGYAAWRFEAMRGTMLPYQAPGAFVAAFPNAEEGDASPNIEPGFKGPGSGDEFFAMRLIGEREFGAASNLFNTAWEQLRGPLDVRHTFVRMPNLLVGTKKTNGANLHTLCSGAYGFSFAAGAEDGPSGLPGFREGMLFTDQAAQGWLNASNVFKASVLPQFLRSGFNATAATFNDACQRPKPVLIPSSQWGWTPDILPFQLVRIGTLAIAAVPSEMTTQAGRRLKARIRSMLPGVTRVVITGLANEYSGYVATEEEYDTQQYEGASTLFGRLTLEAYLHIFGDLAQKIATNTPATPGPTPPDLSGKQISLQTPVFFDSARVWEKFGQVMKPPPASVARGTTVEVSFRAGHPKNNLRTNDSFFFIERKTPGGSWGLVAWDATPETRMAWRLEKSAECSACSFADVRWDVPIDAPTGTYRVRHKGTWKNGLAPANKNLVDYEGTSPEFQVR